MHSKKEEFVKEIFYYIENICRDTLSSSEPYEELVFDVMGICREDLWVMLRKVVNALPDYIFLDQLPDLSEEVCEYLSREYILFQCQEDINDPCFANNLENFIYEVINTINQNYGYQEGVVA